MPELLKRTEAEERQNKANLLITVKMKQRHFLIMQDARLSVVGSCRGLGLSLIMYEKMESLGIYKSLPSVFKARVCSNTHFAANI